MNPSMRNVTLALLACAGLSLAACSGQEDTIEAENESVESVAAKVAKSDIRPRAGRWESRMTIDKMEIPGVPAEMQGMMKQQLGKVQTSVTCLTEEEASKPEADFFQPGDSGCTYDSFSMGGGEIDAEMTCTAQGQTQKMTMAGTYSEEAYDMKVSADGQVAEGQPMSMAMTIASQRVGECTGDEG